MNYIQDVKAFVPSNERQQIEKQTVLKWIATFPDNILTRDNAFAHMTASAMIFDQSRRNLLMVYHKIFDSWAWCGGHADGEQDLIATAMREAEEETGITGLMPLCGIPTGLDILPVKGHTKRGQWVAPHLHLSLCYSFIGDMSAPLRIKEDENTGVRWIPIDRLEQYVTEPYMLPVYRQIVQTSLTIKLE